MRGMSSASRQAPDTRATAPRYQPLVIVLAAACAGVLADRLLAWPLSVWWPAAAVAWIAWLVLWRRRTLDPAAGAILLLAVACSFAAWHHCRWRLCDAEDLGHSARSGSEPACVEAVVVRGPRRLPAPGFNPMKAVQIGERTRLEVEIRGVRDGARWRGAAGRARLNVDGQLLGVHAGDRLRIFAQLTAPGSRRNPGEFDRAGYARAMRRRSYLYASYPDCVTVIDRAGWWGPGRWLEEIRGAGDRLLWQYLDHQRSGLAAAVLLGAREELDAERSQAFMETGTVHLLAISGLHVGIVVGAVLVGLRLAGVAHRRALVTAAVVAILYTLLTDARPPAIRATILVMVLSAGLYFGRTRLAFNALAAAGLVVLALNPADLFRTGVHLSFIAVAGLMWFAPGWFGPASEPYSLDRMIRENRGWIARMLWPVWRTARHVTLVSATIWLLTMPLLMARFHLLTPVAVGLNTVLWLPMAAALCCGLGVLVFGWLLPPVAMVFARGCDGSLWFLERCIDVGRSVPGSHFWVPGPADWWLVGFYGGLALLAALPALRPSRRRCVAVLAAWSGVGLAVPLLLSDRAELDATILSVGHGSAVVIELPSGATMLYDAGQFSSPQYGAQSIAACLWSRGITHLDAVVLSHSDLDHYNALPELLERFSVGAIYVSPVMFKERNTAMAALAKAIREAKVPVVKVSASDRLSGGQGCRIEVLHPPRRGVLGGDNANSVVLGIEYAGRRILLPGDLATPGLEAVLAELPWDCDVLVAPHHGSRRSDPPGLAAWCTPEWVVISGSHRSDVARTAAAYRVAGAQVLHTAACGAVRVRIDAAGLEVTGYLEDR